MSEGHGQQALQKATWFVSETAQHLLMAAGGTCPGQQGMFSGKACARLRLIFHEARGWEQVRALKCPARWRVLPGSTLTGSCTRVPRP